MFDSGLLFFFFFYLQQASNIHRSSAAVGPCWEAAYSHPGVGQLQKKKKMGPSVWTVHHTLPTCEAGEMKIKAKIKWKDSHTFPISKASRAYFFPGCVRFDRGRSKNRDKHAAPDSKNTQRAAESTDGIERHRTMSADTSSGSWLKTTLFKAFYQSPHLPPRLSPPNCCPFISPEWHHDLKLKWAIKPPLIPWQKTVSISVRRRAPVHRILILIIRMLLIMLPSFLLGSWLSESDLILHLFLGLLPSLDHPLLLFRPLFSCSLTPGFHFRWMLVNEHGFPTPQPIDQRLQLCLFLLAPQSKMKQVLWRPYGKKKNKLFF